MAITPAERKSYEERTRQAREEAESRESDLVRRKNEEIKRLEKRHHDEIKNLSENYQAQLENVQGRSRESMSERDMKHRQDVEEVKELYRGQLRKKVEDNAFQKKQLEEAYEGTLAKQKSVSKGQTENLTSNQAEELAARDQKLNDVMMQARKGMEEGLQDNRSRMQGSHEKELSLMQKQREELMTRHAFEKRELTKAFKGEIKNQKRLKSESDTNWNQKYYDTVQSLKEEYGSGLQSQGELLDQEVVNQREKYQNKLAEKSEALEIGNEAFKEDVLERQNTQVRSRDSKIKTLETKLNREMVTNERQKNLEKQNLTQAYEARMRDLNRQVEETSDVMRERSRSQINNVVEENQKLMRNANREFRSQTSMANTINREERKALVEQQNDRLAQTQNMADKRVRTMDKVTRETTKNLANYYDGSLDQMRANYSDKLGEQREQNITEQSANVSLMTNRFRDMEGKYQQRLETVTNRYEDKLAMMKENHDKEIRRQNEIFQQRLKDAGKGSKLEKSSVEQKYESKLALTQERHQEELERLNKRHEEDLKVAVNRAASFSRKA